LTPPDGQPATDAVRRMLAEAEARERAGAAPPPPREPPRPDPPRDPPSGGGGPAPAADGILPDDCPVIPLGLSGDAYYYLDGLGQLREIRAKDHGRLHLQALFGTSTEFLYRHWPRMSQDKTTKAWVTTGWKPELVAEDLMKAGAARGVWSPQARVRGPGAWRGDDGELIVHMGDALLIVPPDGSRPREERPGVVGGYVYPTARAALRPHPDPQPGGDAGPGADLLRLYDSWQFERGTIDAQLMVGVSAAGMLGGALERRPVHWTTGGYGTGKSTLQDAAKWLMGPGGALQTADATAAGIRQALRYSSLPVWLDEAEAAEDNRRLSALVELARSAHTGAMAVRGGSDHESSTFNLYSVLGFSSILIPPLKSQDLSRLLIFRLRKLPPDAKPPKISERQMAGLGRRILRRLVDGWPRWEGTLECYRAAMHAGGHAARGQDVFGTTLAAAHLVLHDGEPQAELDLEPWSRRLSAGSIAEAQPDADEQSCLNFLMTCQLDDPVNRQRRSVADWLRRASGRISCATDEQLRAGEVLGSAGLRMVQEGVTRWMAVANQHTGLARLFAGTHWAGGPDTTGVWVQSLERLEGARKPAPGGDGKPKRYRIGGMSVRCTLLPLDVCLPSDDGPTPKGAPTGGGVTGAEPATGRGPPPAAGSASTPLLDEDPGPDPGPDPHDPWTYDPDPDPDP
jgi:hypothetical protein